MPIFEYTCLDCDEKFETLVLNPKDDISCFSCKSKNIEKQFSPFGIKSESEFLPSGSAGAGCGCTPATCGCGVRN
ncbi:MAG: zinc ribbon domain-containing protein [Deltaproteobacteria bacterium]